MVTFARNHVVTALTNKALKKDMVLFGLKKAEKNLKNQCTGTNIPAGKMKLQTKMQSTCLLQDIRENLKSVNIVELRIAIKLTIGQMLTTNTLVTLMIIFACVEVATENLIL